MTVTLRHLLAIDPSSTAVGWAILSFKAGTWPDGSRVVATPDTLGSGVVKVKGLAAEYARDPKWRMRHLAGALLDAVMPHVRGGIRFTDIVAETPGDGFSAERMKKVSTHYLMAYALACGFITCAIDRAVLYSEPERLGLARHTLHLIPSNVWTRGRARGRGGRAGVPKSRRIEALKMQGGYDGKGDSGGDEADAITLGRWAAEKIMLGTEMK